MKKETIRIDIEIYLVFIVLIGVSVFNAIYSTVIISRNQEASTRIMTVDVPSLQMLENVNLLATRSKMFATNWVYLQSDREDKEKLKLLHESEYPQLKGELLATMTLWGSTAQVDTVKSVFRNFDELIVFEKQIMNSLVSFDDYEDPVKKFGAEEILESKILPRSAEIIATLNGVIVNRRVQADNSHNIMIKASRNLMWSVLGIAIMIVIVVLLAGFYLSNSIILPLMKLKNYIQQMGKGEIPEIDLSGGNNAVGKMTEAVKTLVDSVERTAQFANSIGEGDFQAGYQPLSRKDKLGNALIQMRESLKRADQENKLRNWEATGVAEINQVLRENNDGIEKLSGEVLRTLAQYTSANCGGFYLVEEHPSNRQRRIRLIGGYALPSTHKKLFDLGEGFIGQCIRNEHVIHIKNISQENIKGESGSGAISPAHLLVVPIIHQGTVYGAMEFTSIAGFEGEHVSFMSRIAEIIGSAMASSIANSLTKKLLEETQMQAEQLRLQEEKLRKTNDELSVQGELLRASKEELKSRNEDLKIKAELLQSQNARLEEATEALELKARELEQNNKYKSEFLANMSHELRTPLNSVLILARLLAENKNKTLSGKEIEYAAVIHKSGTDLLSLINDILDLSKIEAGKIELVMQLTGIRQIKTNMLDLFSPIAGEKKIELQTELHSDLPEEFMTDQFRLEQVIKNLLSNALKFTHAPGSVTLCIRQAEPGTKFHVQQLIDAQHVIEFSVRDTGIGIPKEKQRDIFEAFQQADGSTSRKYGGTGLGLSISKMLVGMLGGEMRLESREGKGSTFYVYLPLAAGGQEKWNHKNEAPEITVVQPEFLEAEPGGPQHDLVVPDDRENLRPDDRILLIVEDDEKFAKLLVDISREKNFKAVVASQGDTALQYAATYRPDAILMDMQLPVMDGWTILKKLKEDDALSRIPVHVMSAVDKGALGLKLGALSYLRKPLDKTAIDQAFVGIEQSMSASAKKFLMIGDVDTTSKQFQDEISIDRPNCIFVNADNAASAKMTLHGRQYFDFVFVRISKEFSFNDLTAFYQWMKGEAHLSHLKMLVGHGAELNVEQKLFFSENAPGICAFDIQRKNFAKEIWNKLNAPSGIKSVDETDDEENILKGRTVLIADDDMRNTYSLSAALEEMEMKIIIAGNGKEALDKLAANPQIEIVLMDIMMPVKNGFEAIREIRGNEKWNDLPVFALSADAMSATREKCLSLGANEFIGKPVKIDQLINLLEVWINN